MDRLARLNDDMLPFAAHLGIRFVAAEPDRVVAELTVDDALCTRPAVAHGGVLMAFADTLEHVSRKWIPVSGKKTCFNKDLEQWRESE